MTRLGVEGEDADMAASHEAIRRPNVLLVLVDQMRWMEMGCAGNPHVRTPALDRFAAEGVSMDCAVSNVPVCAPARACLLTGRYPLGHTAITNNSMLPPDIPTTATVLKDAGYATGYIGKWHLAGEGYIGATRFNGGHPGYIPPGEMRCGFDEWAVHHCSHDYRHAFYYRDEPEPIPIEGWEPDGQADLALDFLRRQASGEPESRRPFFLMLSWGTPHTPFGAPPEFEAMYDPATVPLRENVRMSEVFLRCDHRLPAETPEEAIRFFTARYRAAVSNIDWNFGRLLQALDELGLGEETIVLFTSDHGEMLGSQGQMHKLQPWEESIRIPFLVRWPGRLRAGLRSDSPFGIPDVLPTLLSLCGVAVPAGIEGTDFSPLWRGEAMETPESTPLVWPCNAVTWGKAWSDVVGRDNGFPRGFMRPYRGIRTRTHTYVRDRRGPWFLYDNEADPLQERNLVETRSAVPPELEAMLQEWLARTGDAFEESGFYRDNIDLETGLVIDREKWTRF